MANKKSLARTLLQRLLPLPCRHHCFSKNTSEGMKCLKMDFAATEMQSTRN